MLLPITRGSELDSCSSMTKQGSAYTSRYIAQLQGRPNVEQVECVMSDCCNITLFKTMTAAHGLQYGLL